MFTITLSFILCSVRGSTLISQRGLETAPSLLPAPPISPHPADDLHAPDSPTTSLISVLREQLRLLSDQSQQLNAKLVASISRHADLLDAHDSLQSEHKDLVLKADELARDKRQWEESMKTGLLVERSQITLEMQRLASGLVEEERRRGSAEERRRKVEDEVDELAASLFDQVSRFVRAVCDLNTVGGALVTEHRLGQYHGCTRTSWSYRSGGTPEVDGREPCSCRSSHAGYAGPLAIHAWT